MNTTVDNVFVADATAAPFLARFAVCAKARGRGGSEYTKMRETTDE